MCKRTEKFISLALTLLVTNAQSQSLQQVELENINRMPQAVDFSTVVIAPQSIVPTHSEYAARALNQRDIKRLTAVNLDIPNLLNGISRDNVDRQVGRLKATNLIKLEIFPGEIYFLNNKSIHKVTEEVIGLRADVLDTAGRKIGYSNIQILEDDVIVGSIEIPGVASLKIRPTGVDNIHEIVDVILTNGGRQFNDAYDATTPEAIELLKEWDDRMSTPENQLRIEQANQEALDRNSALEQRGTEGEKLGVEESE